MPEQYDEVAGVYAQSLYELAHEAGGLEKVQSIHEELASIVDVSRSDANFGEFLSTWRETCGFSAPHILTLCPLTTPET